MVPLYDFDLQEQVKSIWENDNGWLVPAKVMEALLFKSWLLGSLFAKRLSFVISMKIGKFFISVRFRSGNFTC